MFPETRLRLQSGCEVDAKGIEKLVCGFFGRSGQSWQSRHPDSAPATRHRQTDQSPVVGSPLDSSVCELSHIVLNV